MNFKDSENIRLKVHLVLETEAGEPLFEERGDTVIPGLFCENALDTAQQALDAFLQLKVISPARGMARRHIRALEAKRPFHRTDIEQYVPMADLPNAEEIAAALDAKFMAALSRGE